MFYQDDEKELNPDTLISSENENMEQELEHEDISIDSSLTEAVSALNDHAQTAYVKGVVETILFINERPVSLSQFKRVLETIDVKVIKTALKMLSDEYIARQSGILIKEIGEGYQMLSNSKYASFARQFFKTKYKEKLSKPALETLAIIAYKQPVTRLEIELLRGVNSDGVFNNLVTKELIKIVGRKDIPGKPYLYGTTKQFLEYFGLSTLQDLPKLEDLAEFLSNKEGAQYGAGPEADENVFQQQPAVAQETQFSQEDNSETEE